MIMTINEIRRGKGIIEVLAIDPTDDTNTEFTMFSAKYNSRGRVNKANLIEYIISAVYSEKINPLKKKLSKEKSKLKRAIDYISIKSITDQSKKDKYYEKIRTNQLHINELNYEIEYYKDVISCLYSEFPIDVYTKKSLDRIGKEKARLLEQISFLDMQLEKLST